MKELKRGENKKKQFRAQEKEKKKKGGEWQHIVFNVYRSSLGYECQMYVQPIFTKEHMEDWRMDLAAAVGMQASSVMWEPVLQQYYCNLLKYLIS